MYPKLILMNQTFRHNIIKWTKTHFISTGLGCLFSVIIMTLIYSHQSQSSIIPLKKTETKYDPDGTRTHNPQLRRLMPYPLGHWVITFDRARSCIYTVICYAVKLNNTIADRFYFVNCAFTKKLNIIDTVRTHIGSYKLCFMAKACAYISYSVR